MSDRTPEREALPPDAASTTVDAEPIDRETAEELHWRSLPPMRYQNAYVWFVLFSTIDVVFTWHILTRRGGTEINPVAALLIEHWGFIGAVALKYALVLVVVIACEWISRRREGVSLRLAWLAVAVSLVPPFWSFTLLVMHAMQPGGRGA